MKSHSEIATEYFESGYNCSQAVFLTYAEEYGLDKTTALKLSSSFGGGMGKLREVCGAVTAMFAIAGLKHGYTSNNDDEAKQRHYELIQELANEFKSEFGTIICRELLGLDEETSNPKPTKRTNKFYKERPCSDFIQSACEIIDKKL